MNHTTSTYICEFYSQFYDNSHSCETSVSAVAVTSGNAVDTIGGTVKCVFQLPALTIHSAHPHFINPSILMCSLTFALTLIAFETLCSFVHE